MGIPKTKSITSLREELYETLKKVAKEEPVLVTQKQGDNVVLISQKDYNEILDECETLRTIANGIENIEAKRIVSHTAATKRLKKLQLQWK